jgi:hypothetical protein
MKKVFLLIAFSLLIIVGNATAFDFHCEWEGYMSCSNDLVDDPPVYFKGEVTKKGVHFTTLNITPSPGKKCSGILDGNKISMTCDNGTIGYGEIKGKTIYIIKRKPYDPAICKITATLIE